MDKRKGIFIGALLIFIISVSVTVFVVYKYGFGLFSRQQVVIEKIPDCYFDEECVPKTPLMGIQYLCKDGECIKEAFGNPASTNCQEKEGEIKMRKDPISGGMYGVCVFSDGSECDEWRFFKETCLIGDFNPWDDIWEGIIIGLPRTKYDDYFEMLNGDKLGIDSQDTNIKEILTALQDKENIIKVRGSIIEEATDVFGRQLNVTEILDLGGVQFKEISEEDSGDIAEKAVRESDEYIENKGGNIELIKTTKINCPYCWEFRFSYTSKKEGEKFIDVIIQEGEVRDISEFVGEIAFNDCTEFSMAKSCSKQYDPVCAKIEKQMIGISGLGVDMESRSSVEWRTFLNPCAACTHSSAREKVLGYEMGKCK